MNFESLISSYWELAYKEGKTGESHGTEANEVLFALRQCLLKARQPAVPEGWKMVPVRPTGDMLAALAQEWHPSRYEAFRGRYALMLAAAPEKGA